ncbi:lysine biosynthesis protein [Candidatus Bathyarchaeota archaeon]|nr:lysine biosynthesis protein [Candidatus Bathyarchaeota archaeon]
MQSLKLEVKNITSICVECGAEITMEDDAQKGEITSCPDCGTDYVVELDEKGFKHLTELNLEGEDWGE